MSEFDTSHEGPSNKRVTMNRNVICKEVGFVGKIKRLLGVVIEVNFEKRFKLRKSFQRDRSVTYSGETVRDKGVVMIETIL